jgi:hypothetical protein
MTTPARRPIRTDFTIEVSGPTSQVMAPPWAVVPGSAAAPTPAAAASAGRSTSAVTRLLDTPAKPAHAR